MGHRVPVCRMRPNGRERIAKAAMTDKAEVMTTEEEAPYREDCRATTQVTRKNEGGNKVGATEANFDTGATGSIIANNSVFTNITDTPATTFRGLAGDMPVTKQGMLRGIGRVHYDSRVGMSIVSASECQRRGHNWDFTRKDATRKGDACLLHTEDGTYYFTLRDGLFITDFTTPPTQREPLVLAAPPAAPTITMVYTAMIPTVQDIERTYSKREVLRSALARRFQTALGFPPDSKLIGAIRAGTFIDSDILPDDITRATHMWGDNISSLKGRTTRELPLPQPQIPWTRRATDAQHMHCDTMYINKQPYLVSISHPSGTCQSTCLANASATTIRPALRLMFGLLAHKKLDVALFTSDNEEGIASLLRDIGGINVTVITVGPGQHNHIIERLIRHLKKTNRPTIASLTFLVPDAMMPHLVTGCTRKLQLFPTSTRTEKISPFEVYHERNAHAEHDIGLPFGIYC